MQIHLLTDEHFDQLRQIGDPKADAAIQHWVETEGSGALRKGMAFLGNRTDVDAQNVPPGLVAFFQEMPALPAFADPAQMDLAFGIHQRYFQQIGIVLGCYSLPYCFLAANGAKVLHVSDKIRKQAYNRIFETNEFITFVMQPDHWADGRAAFVIQKVRLLHAAVRFFIRTKGEWSSDWGVPVNQEDALGTNLAFSYIVMKGLRKLGFRLTEVQEWAYVHTWNVIGAWMGIPETLLPENWDEAEAIDAHIARRQFRPSPESRALMQAFMATFREVTGSNFARDMLLTQTRLMIGVTYAEALAIPQTRIPIRFLHSINQMGARFHEWKTSD